MSLPGSSLAFSLTSSADQPPASPHALNGVGLFILIVAVVAITTMLVWCYSRILRRPPDPKD